MLKVRAHTCYLGSTGYASHARKFFRELSKHVDLRVRNYTWDSNPDYLDQTDLNIIDTITLRTQNDKDQDFHISHSFPKLEWKNKDFNFSQDVDIVLMDMDHHYFYEEYNSKVKIAYTVWESTELPQDFFNQLLKFDYLWVVTEWHKQVAIKQGYPEHRIFVVHEGVDSDLYYKKESGKARDKFEFMFFGRWDYRKAVPEIVKTFLEAFPDNDGVELILSADNPYSIDGLNSTEERLEHYGLVDERIKIKHFPPREEYEDYIKNGHVLITCARSEGWNIPLIEAMSAGTPVIYSNWGAQLEFAEGKGNPVKIEKELPASIGSKLGFASYTTGLYAEPDFGDLKRVMIDCYENWGDKKKAAREEAEIIYKEFNWERVGKEGFEVLKKVLDFDLEKPTKKEAVVILSHADSKEKISVLKRSVLELKRQGYFVIVSSHISIPDEVLRMCDYFICETDNPVVMYEEFHELSNSVPIHYLRYHDFELSYSLDFNHGYAALRLILNGARLAKNCGFNKTHFINYDYIIEDENTLIRHSELLEENSIVTYRWNPENSISSAFFSGINDDILRSIESTQSKKDYFRYEGVTILEDFIYQAFTENGLKMWIGDIKDVSKKNLINSVIIPAYPRIKTKNGKFSYLYLGHESTEGKNYLCAIGNEEPLEGQIIKGGKTFDFSAGSYPMNFYIISDEELEKGVTVILPKYDEVFNYNLKTKKASILIKNKDLILDLEGKENRPRFNINFFEGPFVEVKDAGDKEFRVDFIDSDKNFIHYTVDLKNNTWARCSIQYYKNWLIRIVDKSTGDVYEEKIDLRDKNVMISIESSSLGDSLSWFPHIEEFRKIHGCNIFASTFKNELFAEKYPNITFIKPGQVVNNIHTIYRIGWFYDGDKFNSDRHPRDFKNIPMQATTTDILGLPHSNLRPNLVIKDSSRPMEEDYVCIGYHSTAQAKYWNNPTGWQELVDWLISKGKKVVMISHEIDGYMGNKNPEGVIYVDGEKTLDNAIRYIKNSDMFIGIGSGLSWLSWSLDVPTVLISGFSTPKTEFLGPDIIRIFNSKVCNGCFNRERLDAGDWNWCPDHKGTDRQFECTKTITSKDVIEKIENYWAGNKSEKEIDEVLQESYDLGMVQNHEEILGAAEFFKKLNVVNFMEIGTDQGGTFAIWSKLSKSDDGIRISVDLPHGEYGRPDYDVVKRDEYLKSLGSNVTMIHGSSHDYKILEEVESIIGDDLLDFLFIDGDHTYEGVKQDYEMYRHLVKPGGWIGFHDTKDTDFHRNVNCRVDILWNELGGNKIEFLDNTSAYGGIGYIQNN